MSGRTFLYNAHGFAFGGTITHPFKAELDSHAATSLPVVGGHASAKAENYRLKDVVSYRSAHTSISGVRSDDGVHSTVATTTVEGLNILDVITADVIIAKLSSSHDDKGEPRISPAGSLFQNLKIAGQSVDVDLQDDLITRHPTHSALLGHFEGRSKAIKAGTTAAAPAKTRFQWGLASEEVPPSLQKGMLVPPDVGWQHSHGVLYTSLVTQVRPTGSNNSPKGLPYAYAFHIPDVGSIFLAELFSSADTKRLNMLRVELGSPVGGRLATAQSITGGNWYP